ncbi:hypothetical protein XENORESO_004191 [Xenotaenia resolanae]|uniref:Uncharacterized protein n=1 Tax=Xenotaenia resolanae TaxID=208358 RepID=A0ABV0WYH7_9TELE
MIALPALASLITTFKIIAVGHDITLFFTFFFSFIQPFLFPPPPLQILVLLSILILHLLCISIHHIPLLPTPFFPETSHLSLPRLSLALCGLRTRPGNAG